MARGTVGIDGFLSEIVGAAAGDAKNAPAVPEDVTVSLKDPEEGRLKSAGTGRQEMTTVPGGSDLESVSAFVRAK